MRKRTTTITILYDTREKLKDLGKKSDTYDSIIRRLMP
jgi:predicted CopG family antitoxin